jgi:L-fuconolactonase
VKRRNFQSATLSDALARDTLKVPIIDSRVRLFDVSRPQGLAWPPKDSSIYKAALPERYRKIVTPHSIVGAIEIL